MNILKTLAASLLSFAVLALPSTAEQLTGTYDCRATAAGGLRFDEQSEKWVGGKFNVEGEGFYINLTNYRTMLRKKFLDKEVPHAIYDFKITEYGDNSANNCINSWRNEITFSYDLESTHPYLNCNINITSYSINFSSLKYMKQFSGAYVFFETDRSTPYVEIGQCTKLPF